MTYFNIIILILVFVLILFLFITGMGGGGGVQEYYDFFFPSSSPDSLSSISPDNTITFDLSINTVYTPTGTRVSESTYSHYMYKVYSITIDKNYSHNVLNLVLEGHNDVRLPDTFRFEFQNNKTKSLVVKTDFDSQIIIGRGGSGSCDYNSKTKDMECAASLR